MTAEHGNAGGRAVIGVEPFDAGSHRAIRESLARRSRHRWTWITRPGRAWKWRMRTAALELAADVGAALEETGASVLFTTSLLGTAELVAAIRRLAPRHSARLTVVLYMHENQAAYPIGPSAPEIARRDVQFALTNLASIAAADLVLWNSRWNAASFAEAMRRLLRRAPDRRPGVLESLLPGGDGAAGAVRHGIAWPPVEPPPDGIARRGQGPGDEAPVLQKPVRVLWPHRWEHDKGPDGLLDLARRDAERLDLRFTLLGARGRAVPRAIEILCDEFAARIDHAGYVPDRAAYWAHVAACDWVLSTARHEFFGIAVTEALLAGCLPWLPDRLSYPELLPAEARGLTPAHPPPEPGVVRRALARHLAPAMAAASVARIDAEIEAAVRRRAAQAMPDDLSDGRSDDVAEDLADHGAVHGPHDGTAPAAAGPVREPPAGGGSIRP